MSINLELPKLTELKPRIVVVGVGGAGGNAVNNMIASGLEGVEYIAANTDAQALLASSAERRIQLGMNLTEGLGAGSKPEIGEAAAEEAIEEVRAQVTGAHMVFIAAGMGGGTGTGAAAVIARAARELGVLTVGIVTKPFQFEGTRRQRIAEAGIAELRKYVDTLIVIPNQNLFRIATEKTTFAEAFVLADQVLYSGIACIVDLIIKDGLINLDFADVRTVMSGMGSAMMGTGEASGERRALRAAEEAIANPLLDEVSLKGAKGLLLSIIGGRDMTLYEVDEAASRVREEVDADANIIVGATFDEQLGDKIRVAIVASGMNGLQKAAPRQSGLASPPPVEATTREPSAAPPPPGPPALPRSYEQAPPQPSASSPQPGWPPPFRQQPSADAGAPRSGEAGTAAARPHGSQPAGHGPAPRELWHAPGNVVIEEARLPRQAMHAVKPEMSAPSQPATSGSATDSFMPAPPEDLRRQPTRRVPNLEEFPVVGQRDFNAKTTRYDAPAETGANGRGREWERQDGQPREGLLQRIMGHGRRPSNAFDDDAADGGSERAAASSGFFKRNK